MYDSTAPKFAKFIIKEHLFQVLLMKSSKIESWTTILLFGEWTTNIYKTLKVNDEDCKLANKGWNIQATCF